MLPDSVLAVDADQGASTVTSLRNVQGSVVRDRKEFLHKGRNTRVHITWAVVSTYIGSIQQYAMPQEDTKEL